MRRTGVRNTPNRSAARHRLGMGGATLRLSIRCAHAGLADHGSDRALLVSRVGERWFTPVSQRSNMLLRRWGAGDFTTERI